MLRNAVKKLRNGVKMEARYITTFTPLEEALGRAMVGMIKPAIRRGTRLIDLLRDQSRPGDGTTPRRSNRREYIRIQLSGAPR